MLQDVYCISSNNSRGAIIQLWQLFQIFLTGGRALNILFYYTKQ